MTVDGQQSYLSREPLIRFSYRQAKPSDETMVSLEYVVMSVANPRKRAQHGDEYKYVRDDASGQDRVILLCAVSDDVDDFVDQPAVSRMSVHLTSLFQG